jgi:hypothetical protein
VSLRRLTTPSGLRTRVVVAGLVAVALALIVLVDSVVPLVVWGGVMFASTMLLLDDSTGRVTNNASILAGRPIAPTARGREPISLDHLTREQRRDAWILFPTLIAILLVAAVAAFSVG